MATQPNTSGRKLLILLGNGASPEVFAHPCSINGDRGFSREAATTDEPDQDCDNPDLPGWLVRTVDSFSASISGAGRVKLGDVAAFDEWFESGLPRNVKVMIDAVGGRTYTGAFVLSTWNMTGPESGSMTGDIALQSTGPVVSADNA